METYWKGIEDNLKKLLMIKIRIIWETKEVKRVLSCNTPNEVNIHTDKTKIWINKKVEV